jgi:hypothetical protein
VKKISSFRSDDRLFRTAAWFYLVPRVLKVGLVLGAVAVAVAMVALSLVRQALIP